MAKKVIVAKMTAEVEGQKREFIGKREVKMYDENTKMEGNVIDHANQGLTLVVQRQIRDALKVKYGLKAVVSGGESVDLSAVESV